MLGKKFYLHLELAPVLNVVTQLTQFVGHDVMTF